MSAIITKLLAVFMSVFMTIYGGVGLVGNISDDYEEGKYKNVIFFIGDGMGENILKKTKQYYNIDTLAMETMPVRGQSQTHPFGGKTTDSAAGGTALACGVRTFINAVAVFPFDPFTIDDFNVPITLAELAKSQGKKAGVVTTDKTSGATPSAFSAHALSRGMEKDISADQLESGLDLIWGSPSESINETNTAENGFTYVDTKAEMYALSDDSRSFGQFSDLDGGVSTENSPSLAEMTMKAVDILDEDEDGFFLMVEAAHIDKNSHKNNFDGAMNHVLALDKAVAAALAYAKLDGETLVLVTADHETGGVTYNEETDEYYYTTGSHTSANVPLFVSAEDAGFINDAVKNREISVQVARVMGYGPELFPASKNVVMAQN